MTPFEAAKKSALEAATQENLQDIKISVIHGSDFINGREGGTVTVTGIRSITAAYLGKNPDDKG